MSKRVLYIVSHYDILDILTPRLESSNSRLASRSSMTHAKMSRAMPSMERIGIGNGKLALMGWGGRELSFWCDFFFGIGATRCLFRKGSTSEADLCGLCLHIVFFRTKKITGWQMSVWRLETGLLSSFETYQIIRMCCILLHGHFSTTLKR